jgi:hypothetical protein
MQKMENFTTYAGNQQDYQPWNESMNNINSGGIPDTTFYTDSAMVQIDSSLFFPTDTAFRFWEVELEEKLFVGDLRYPPDTTYLERISWGGLKINHREITTPDTDWLTILLFLAFVILASVSAGYSKYIGSLLQSLINYPTAFRMFREKNYSILHGAFRLEVLFYFVFSIFVFQIFVLASTSNSFYNITGFGQTFAVVVVYFLVKKLAYQAFGSIFIDTADTAEFLFNMDNFKRGAGIFLFPIVALIAYFPSEDPMIAVFLGVFTALVFYVMLLKRGISILLKKQFPIFYLFLYLCTLEFLPLLLIYKIAVE